MKIEPYADLFKANLSGANLFEADLTGANLTGAYLTGANLRCANLIGANLTGANLRYTNLKKTDLTGANLRNADFSGANLIGANISGADLRNADLSAAYLHSADLSGANLHGVIGLPNLVVPGLAAAVLRQIMDHPETWNQRSWHSCAAGWACVLAGVPKEIEELLGTRHAAMLAFGLPLSDPSKFRANDDPRPWLAELAGSLGGGHR